MPNNAYPISWKSFGISSEQIVSSVSDIVPLEMIIKASEIKSPNIASWLLFENISLVVLKKLLW